MDALIGVLALQGAFAAHEHALSSCGVHTRQVRVAEDLTALDGLVIPGGESTTMSNLLLRTAMFDAVRDEIRDGLPVFGTCAGMIMLAHNVLDGRADQVTFDAMDIDVRRNAYGRQVDSFETDLNIDGLSNAFHAVFIRAPKVERIGPGVEVLSKLDGVPVLVRERNCLAASFHPELSMDASIHRLFVQQVLSRPRVSG